jgi:hypothetical protein
VSDGTTTASLASFTITVSSTTTGAGTGSVTLSWTPPTTNTNGTSPVAALAGYHIYYGTSTGALTKSVAIINPAANSATITGLSTGTWYFAISADAADGSAGPLSVIGSKTL